MINYKVDWESMIRTTEGPLKPDLIVSIGNCALIIDIAICSYGIDPDKVYKNKIANYAPVADALDNSYSDIKLSAFVVNWGGAVARRTLEDFEPFVTTKGFSTASVWILQYGSFIWGITRWLRATF